MNLENVNKGKQKFLPYKTNLTKLAQENRNNPTKAERKIWNEVLRRKKLKKYKFIRQKPIDNFIVDFYCSQKRLVIEIDGDSHSEKQEYDTERSRILERYGLRVLRYTNEEVLKSIEGIYEDLVNLI